MKPATEQMVRSVLSLDESVSKDVIDNVVKILHGQVHEEAAPLHAIKPKIVAKLLCVSLCTLNRYLARGLLDRVYDGHTNAIGISRDSFLRFSREITKGKGARS